MSKRINSCEQLEGRMMKTQSGRGNCEIPEKRQKVKNIGIRRRQTQTFFSTGMAEEKGSPSGQVRWVVPGKVPGEMRLVPRREASK
jgi:hypothetical protein